MSYKRGGLEIKGMETENPYKKCKGAGDLVGGDIPFCNRGYLPHRCDPTIVESKSDLSIAKQLIEIKRIMGITYALFGKKGIKG